MKYLIWTYLLLLGSLAILTNCGSVQRIKKEAIASGTRLQDKTETIIIEGIKDAEKEISDCLDADDFCAPE